MKRMFLTMSSIAAVLLTAAVALAQEEAATGSSPMLIENAWAFALAVAIGIGLAAFGGAFGQARAASAALEGISRNPNASDKVFVPMILGLAFIESLVLFTWVLMFLLLGKF